MSYKIFIIVFVLAIPQWLQAQVYNNPHIEDWVINEVYVSKSPTRYGLFVELYNPAFSKNVSGLYISSDKKQPHQFRVKTRSRFTPDLRKRGYHTAKVSAVRFKMKTIKMYEDTDTLYLYRSINYEFVLQDSFPVIWNDSLSLGRCGKRICYFNIPTPGRVNKNVSPQQYMPRRGYHLSILGGSGTANNTDYNKYVGRIPSFGVKGQKFINRRSFYTTTTAAIFHQGYSFKDTTVTDRGTRRVEGYHSSLACWVGKEIGVYLTPRFDLCGGAALVLGSYAQQRYTVQWDNQNDKERETIGNYPLPVLTFNIGLNYQLTPDLKIELFQNLLFRTFEKSETIYYHSLSIGLSKCLKRKGRGYREGILW